MSLNIHLHDRITVTGKVNVVDAIKLRSGNTDYYYTKEEVDKQITELREETIPTRLSVFPQARSDTSRDNQLVYIDDNGVPSKTSVRNLLSKQIRTDEELPSDMQVGEFLFKVNKEA